MKQRAIGMPLPLMRRRPEGESSPLPDVVEAADEVHAEISVDLIDRSPNQPRLKMDPARIEELAENIEATGKLYSPIVVRRKPDGRYELIAGERRLTAVRLLKWETVVCKVRNVSDADAKLETYVENLGREDLFPFETALLVKDMLDSGMARTQREVARLTAMSPPNVSMYVSYFDLPEKSVALLREKPELIGLRDGYDLARLVKAGHSELVEEAIALAFNGKISANGAVRWVNDHATNRTRRKSQKQIFQSSNGKDLCTLSRGGDGKLVVAPQKGDVEEIQKVIEAALADYAAKAKLESEE